MPHRVKALRNPSLENLSTRGMPCALGYRTVRKLLACPFCREMVPQGAGEECEHCGVRLVPMEKLPPSLEALEEEAQRGEYTPPEYRALPFSYLGRGRGALLMLSALGLLLFFAPWVEIWSPSEVVLSGYDLARARAGWLWGGAVGWFLLIPLTVTRRSVVDLRGVRVIAATFAVMTLCEALMLLLLAPTQSPYVRTEYGYAWGLYASAGISALGCAVAARLGGRIDDLRDLANVIRLPETSSGQPLH